jgi:predicted ArsR family transcriptional regulator
MVREVVLASGMAGIAMSEIESRLCLSNTAIRKHLMRLRAAGVVERTHDGGQACRWGPPGIYDAFADQRARAARKPRKLSGWERLQKEQEADEWADKPAVRVIVRAADAIPLGKVGPNSVWQLAA